MATSATTSRPDTTTRARQSSQAAPPPRQVSLPDGWHHSVLVAWLLDQPRERRETALAGLFALTGALWAPLGVLSLLAGAFAIFLIASAVVLLVAAAPRPDAVADLRVAAVERLRLREVGRRLTAAFHHARARLSELGPGPTRSNPTQSNPRSAR